MKNYLSLILFVVVLSMSSCFSTKEMGQVVGKKVLPVVNTNVEFVSPNITLNTPSPVSNEKEYDIIKQRHYFIPLFFFWKWNSTYDCTIGQQYFVNTFTQTLKEKVKEFELERHLGDRQLEITIENVPTRFRYSNQGDVIFLIFFYVSSTAELVEPVQQKIQFSYQLLNPDNTVKMGNYSFELKDPLKVPYRSSEDLISIYLDVLKEDFNLHSEKLIDQIIDGL